MLSRMDMNEDLQTLVDFLMEMSISDRHVTSRDSLWLKLSAEALERYRTQTIIVEEPKSAKELAQQLLLLL
jgi:hypothetical protein